MGSLVSTPLKSFLTQYKDIIDLAPDQLYKLVTVSNNGSVRLRKITTGHTIKSETAYRIRSGSFIYSRLAAHTGSYGLVPQELDGAIVTGEMPVFEIDHNSILPEYFIYYVRQNSFRYLLTQLIKGMGRTRIKESKFLDLSVPIHSNTVDQQIIIDSLDKKYSVINKISDQFTRQHELTDQLRQALLKDAIEGKLTANWRHNHPELICEKYNASTILENVKAERSLISKRNNINNNKALPTVRDEEKKFDLPNGWTWCRFGDYTTFERGRFSIRPRNDKSCFGGKYPFIQIGALSNDGKVISEYQQTLNEKGFSVSKQFVKGTIVIAIVGGTIGNLGVLGLDMCFPDSIIGIQPLKSVNQDYILLLLKAKQTQIREKAYQMAGQPNIKIPTLAELAIALPPLSEQQAIVDRVNQILKIINDISGQVSNRTWIAESLMQSVLKEAFTDN